MVTKAGATSNKVVVGVASYGQAFKMASAGYTGPECTFTGMASGARKGCCTDGAGYISNNEI
jgi:GH18 family chitinase